MSTSVKYKNLYILGGEYTADSGNMPLFISAGFQNHGVDLYINGSGAGAFNNNMTLYALAPATGVITHARPLYVRGAQFTSSNTMPLFTSGPGEVSGMFPLKICGANPLYPDETYRYDSQLGKSSSGYIPVGDGVTAYINGE